MFVSKQRKSQYKPYEESREFAHTLNFKRKEDWGEYVKDHELPKGIPKSVYYVYSQEGTWVSWSDFLGYDPNDRPLETPFSLYDVKEFMESNGITTKDEWESFCRNHKDKIPKGIPVALRQYFMLRGEWKGYPYIFGTRDTKNLTKSYEEHQKLAETINVTSIEQWENYWHVHKLPEGYAIDLAGFFKRKKQWKGAHEFFKKRSLPSKSYDEHKLLAKSIDAKSIQDWDDHWKDNELPEGYAFSILGYFSRRKEWDVDDFFDKKKWPYDTAKQFLASHKLKNKRDYAKFLENNDVPKLPAAPQNFYQKRGTWIGWGDFLSTGNRSPKQISENYLPWKEAKPIYQKLAKKYGLKNRQDWIRFARTHKKLLEKLRIPQDPWRVYSKEREWKRSMKDD
tara:strand:- start:27 stop:1211 length:1185 start_codon:yes stop_codon:yes gene_type:complete